MEDKNILHWIRLEDVLKTLRLHQDECLLGIYSLKKSMASFELLWADKSSNWVRSLFLKWVLCILVSKVSINKFWLNHFIKSYSLKVGILLGDVSRGSSMNDAASWKAIPLSLFCWSEKYSPSCFLYAVLYKLLKQALWCIASWAILSRFLSF